MSQYIELNRTFFDYSENEDIEDAAVRSYIASLHHGVLDWSKLLQSQCVVILGEAGSGKTWEMEHQVEVISQAGGYAFFLRLEQLLDLSVDLKKLISPVRQQNRYAEWLKKPKQDVIFFLDAKDEAALKSSHALQDALTNFTSALGISSLLYRHVASQKTHISLLIRPGKIDDFTTPDDIELSGTNIKVVISCRGSEWRPIDLDMIRRCFDLPKETDSQKQKETYWLRVVRLTPLDRDQVKCLIAEQGISDAKAFLQAVDSSHAWFFLKRPLDVPSLVNYWKQHNKQLGSLHELIEYDIDCKLAQHGDTHKDADPLTSADSRLAAEGLAAATLFCKEFKIAVPDSDEPIQGISPTTVLPANWNNKQLRYVLNRPLFDGETFRHVRFHHRQTAEYLSASWLNTLLANGCPLSDIESLLFVERYGQAIVPPSRAPAAAWLAVSKNETWNQRIRQRLLQAHPEILLRYGDPQSLAIEDRRGLLAALIGKYQTRQRAYIETDYEKLALFAVPELAQDINAHLQNQSLTIDLRILLLELVETGRLSDCVATALDIFQQPEEQAGLQRYAARAICSAGSPEQQRQLVSMIQTYPVLSPGLCAIVTEELYPGIVDTTTLVSLLGKTESLSRDNASTLAYFIERALEKHVPDKDLERLLEQFIQLLKRPPFIIKDNKPIGFSDCYTWLGKSLGIVAQRLLQRPELHADLIEHLADAMDLLEIHNEISDLSSDQVYLPEESRNHPLLRSICAWRYIHLNHSVQKPVQFNIGDYYSPVLQNGLQVCDIDWLISDSMRSETRFDRETAFTLAIRRWNTSGRQWPYRKRFREVLKQRPELKAVWRDNVRNTIPWYLTGKWQQIRHRYKLYGLKRKLRYLPRDIKDKWQGVKNYVWLLRHLPGLRSGKEWYALTFLMTKAKKSDSMKWGTADWKSLRSLYGRLITHAARSGWKAHWRTFTPLLPHEKPEINRTDRQVALGLTGLYTEFADGLEPTSLSPQEARLAAIYAVNELNGFPDWFNVLAHAHKEAVHAVLLACIQGEWRIPAEQEHVHQVLSKLNYAAPSLQERVYEDVLNLLLQSEPANHAVLTQALSLVMRQTVAPGHRALSHVAQQRLQALTPDDPAFMMWLIIWLQLEAVGALDFIRAHLNTSSGKFMEKLCAALQGRYDRGYPLVKNPAYLQAALLEDLIPLVYQHVRPEDDITHEGAYSPGERDEAQDFRRGLLPKLAEMTTPEAYQALTRLAEHPMLADRRDWIHKLLVDHAELSAEEAPWQPRQVAEFAARFEKNIHTQINITQNVQGNDNTFSATGNVNG